jgi:hypothetical protein
VKLGKAMLIKRRASLKKNFQFSFLLNEQPQNRILISPTDRGLVRLKKIKIILQNFYRAKMKEIKFDLNFMKFRIFLIQTVYQDYIYDVTRSIAKVLKSEEQGLAVLNNPALFILPSETLRSALLRIIRLSLINIHKSKREIQSCIEINTSTCQEVLCSEMTLKKFNTITLQILNSLRISTVIITLELDHKFFPEIDKFPGQLILFETIENTNTINSYPLQVSGLK